MISICWRGTVVSGKANNFGRGLGGHNWGYGVGVLSPNEWIKRTLPLERKE